MKNDPSGTVILNEDGGNLTGQVCHRFNEDAVRVMAHRCAVLKNHIIDTTGDKSAHRDGIQLIPPSPAGMPNDQYAAGTLSFATIASNTIHSRTQLQGIFASDGLFENVTIVNNEIDTESEHEITINGLLSGQVAYNTRYDGKPCKVVLNPLRIGGGADGRNVWVIGMRDRTYHPINFGRSTECPSWVTDRREVLPDSPKKNHFYIKGLHIGEFRRELRKIPYGSTAQFAQNAQDLALKMGRIAV